MTVPASAALLLCMAAAAESKIDREAVVSRHFPTAAKITADAFLALGNGQFGMAADATGLQVRALPPRRLVRLRASRSPSPVRIRCPLPLTAPPGRRRPSTPPITSAC